MEPHTMNAVALMVGCILLIGQADAYTKLVSNDFHPHDRKVYVPKDEDFRVQCETGHYQTDSVSTEYRHRLFKKEGDRAVLLDTNPADGCETLANHTVKSAADGTSVMVEYLFTIFRLKAEQAGPTVYGCMLVAKDAPTRKLTLCRSNLTVEVCSEPIFSLSMKEGNSQREVDVGSDVVLNTTEKCGFNGAVAYLVNGVPVPRKSSGEASSPQAVQMINSSLEIRSPVCVGYSVCNVTARFTYVFEGKVETSQAQMSLNDCCIDDGTLPTQVPTEATGGLILNQNQKTVSGCSWTPTTVVLGIVVLVLLASQAVLLFYCWKSRRGKKNPQGYTRPPGELELP